MNHHTDDSNALDDTWSSQAEQVRAYLVHVRGGAPFLSGADGRLLLSWLEAGFSVPSIVVAIDKTAARRRAKRSRSRLTLNACRKALSGHSPQETIATAPAPPTETEPLQVLAAEIANQEVSADQQPHRDALVSKLMALPEQHSNRDNLAMAAIEACTDFHVAVWESSTAMRQELYAIAEAELAALAGALSARLFQDLLEETARGHLRQRFPLVSANTVWDRLTSKPESSVTP